MVVLVTPPVVEIYAHHDRRSCGQSMPGQTDTQTDRQRDRLLGLSTELTRAQRQQQRDVEGLLSILLAIVRLVVV